MKLVDPKWLTNRIMIIDFGIAFPQDNVSSHIGTPKAYCAPEFLFKSLRSVASDIWALGCTIFEIRTGSSLFRFGAAPSRDQTLVAVVELLGKLPAMWWDEWEKGREWYGNEIKEGGELAKKIEGTLHQHIMEIGLHDGDKFSSTSRRINATFVRSVVEDSKSGVDGRSTESLVALVNQITTDDARELIALVNKSSVSDEKLSSESTRGGKPAGGTSSGDSNKTQSGSGAGSSSSKAISTEGITLSPETSINVSTEDNGPEPEPNIHKQESKSPLATVKEILEEEGTVITNVEGDVFEALLRSVLRLLPEDRVLAAELAKHEWFTTHYDDGSK